MSAKHLSNFNDERGEALQHFTISRHRILVVEDQDDLRQLTAEVLMDSGYQVEIAEDAAAAFAAIGLSHYDLLITDQFLPKSSGIELLRKIHLAHMSLPIIMATGFLPIREFALHPFLRGVNLLFKPYSFEKLLIMVSLLLPTTVRASQDISLPPLPSEAPRPLQPYQAASGFATRNRQ